MTIDSHKVEKLIQQMLPNTPVGIYLEDAKTGKVIYERRSNETFQPGSNTKLFSAAASLFILGPKFQYETSLLVNPDTFKSGVVNGDLYVKFSGDPSLTTLDLQNLVKDLKNAGVKQITGNIVLDNTLFKDPVYGPGWGWCNLNWYYAAPITAIMLNENKIKVVLTPNKTLGEKGSVALAEDEITQFQIKSDIISVTETDAEKNCRLDVDINENNDISMTGCWPAKDKADTLKVAIKNPTHLAEQILLESFKTENISFSGKITVGKSPENLKQLAVHRSVPLADLLKPILLDSNNLYAESITKMMGVIKFHEGTFQAGTRAIKEVLNKEFGIPSNQLSLEDGSGLSRFNLVTPAQLARLLFVMFHNKEFSELFINALPSAGATGTLKNRMQTFDVKDQIRAKTGTLNGVSTLSGYITKNNKPELIFSIMINNALESAEDVQFENELCKLFLLELNDNH